MRLVLALVFLAVLPMTEANAVVCAKGVYRAGCAGPHGAVVAHRPVGAAYARPVARPVVGAGAHYACRYVNGVRVCR